MGLADRDYLRADAAERADAARAAAAASRFAVLAALALVAIGVWQLGAGRWPIAVGAGAAAGLLLALRVLPRRRRSARPPDAELDTLLDRVSAVGLEGLTEAERAALDRASSALRDRRGY